ncbi:MAG: hypothetical protein J6Y08_03515 [Clostridiales bacterium]|nr:hypothetical protein [Clostridiales bacterium]
MKRVLSVICAAVLAMSCTACSNFLPAKGEDEESTKKSRKESEPSEEETTESSSEETTASEITSESSEDSTVSETEPTDPALPQGDVINILSSYYTYQDAYGAMDPKDAMNTTYFGTLKEDIILINDTICPELAEELDSILLPHQDTVTSLFETSKTNFFEALSSGNALVTNEFSFKTALYRADNKIFSFVILTSPSQAEGTVTTYNYESESGTLIAWEDVILDNDAFIKLLTDTVSELPESSFAAKLSDITAAIENGTISFTMTYDGIVLFLPEFVNFEKHSLHICLLDHPEIANSEYFGQAPESFALFSDVNDCLTWDMDGDGDYEKIAIESVTDDYDNGVEFTIDFDGDVYSSAKDFPDLYGFFDHAFLTKNGENWFLYLIYAKEELGETTLVFSLSDGTVEYVDTDDLTPTSFTYINPENLTVMFDDDTFGYLRFSQKATFGKDGRIQLSGTDFNTFSTPVTTKVELSGELYSESDDGDPITIPKDSTVVILGYSLADNTILMSVVSSDEPVFVKFACDGTGIAGHAVFDVFYYLP